MPGILIPSQVDCPSVSLPSQVACWIYAKSAGGIASVLEDWFCAQNRIVIFRTITDVRFSVMRLDRFSGSSTPKSSCGKTVGPCTICWWLVHEYQMEKERAIAILLVFVQAVRVDCFRWFWRRLNRSAQLLPFDDVSAWSVHERLTDLLHVSMLKYWSLSRE